jgi:hypothetical protein
MALLASQPAWVYFIRPVGQEGPVKVGCSGVPENRLLALATWSPYPLEIVARYPGTLETERRFHALFADSYSHREWFHATPLISAVIHQINEGSFDPARLPVAQTLGRERHPGWTDGSRLAARFSQRVRRLEQRGVTVPKAVSEAAWLFSPAIERDWRGNRRNDPADAQTVEDFLARNDWSTEPLFSAVLATLPASTREAA